MVVTQSGPEALRSKLDTITTMSATCRSSGEKWFKKVGDEMKCLF